MIVTEPMRHEAWGSIYKHLFRSVVKHRQGQTSVDRSVGGNTQEYTKMVNRLANNIQRGLTIGVIQVHEQ